MLDHLLYNRPPSLGSIGAAQTSPYPTWFHLPYGGFCVAPSAFLSVSYSAPPSQGSICAAPSSLPFYRVSPSVGSACATLLPADDFTSLSWYYNFNVIQMNYSKVASWYVWGSRLANISRHHPVSSINSFRVNRLPSAHRQEFVGNCRGWSII